MSAWNDKLTGVHLEIAAEIGTPIHVLAGPGTGKTFAMMRRVARLLEEGVDPKTVLTLSFTRTAAGDLRNQLAKLVANGASEVRASTLHSLCFSLLSQAAVFALTGRVARPLLSYVDWRACSAYARLRQAESCIGPDPSVPARIG